MKTKLLFLGECPIDPAKLVAELFPRTLKMADAFQRQKVTERKAWTRAIKGTLKEIAERKYRNVDCVCQVLYSRREEERSIREWLVDVVWWVNGTGATLAAECEFNLKPWEIV